MKKIDILIAYVLVSLAFSFREVNADRDYIPPYHENWPVQITGVLKYSPGIADIDLHYPGLEIISGGGNSGVYAWHEDGTLVEGWPVLTNFAIETSPAIADLDPNYPGLEVVIGARNTSEGGVLYAFHADGTVVNGWPQPICPFIVYIYSTPTIADIDVNYPGLEVIMTQKVGWEGGGSAKIYAFHNDGTAVNGYPEMIGNNLSYVVATGDVDPNYPRDEIVFASESMYDPQLTRLHARHGNGTSVSGFPIVTSNFITKIILADIDGDGQLEIVGGTGTSTYGSPQYPAMVYVWRNNGELVEGWPVTINNNVTSLSLSVGNVDNQGGLEIIASDENNIYIWHSDGTSLNGWPVAVNAVPSGEPLIADIGQHNDMEILLALQNGTIKVWHSNGQLARIILQAQSELYSTPAIEDIDLNGTMEIIACSSPYFGGTGYVDIWDLRSRYNSQYIEWGEFRHDGKRSGLYISP